MNKTVLITGASSGIGMAAAERFAAAGYNLIITARRAARLAEVERALGEKYEVKIQSLIFDVRSLAECERAIGSIREELGGIDILVNNAGLASGYDHIESGDSGDWDAMIDTNVKGLLYITKLVSKIMVERGRGHIINIGSIAGTQAYEYGAAYCASKHAVHALSQGMRIDLLTKGVKVTEIRPGMVETEFSLVRFHGNQERADKVYEGVKPLTGEDIAEAIFWAASLPEHVNIDDILMTPKAQASVYYVHREQ
ncbi:MAG: SDR family NAD(P)-dependent oxidoreductase [Rikenellaceae bacterium]